VTDLDELSRLLEQATKGPWIEMEMHPYLFANPRGPQPWHHDIVGRFDYHSDANRAAIAALRNHAEELVRDARRLARLERMFRVMSPNIDGNHAWTFTGSPTLRGPNLRAAIDAAIAQEQPNSSATLTGSDEGKGE
jgi:hypothetical protein